MRFYSWLPVEKIIQLVLMLIIFIAAANPALAALPYNEQANAQHDIARAFAQAKLSNRKVLMIFGANWCPDCRRFDRSIHNGETPIDPKKFVTVNINVGNFDKNLELVRAYGNPIRKGIPAAIVLTSDKQILYRGSLANFLMPHRRLMKITLLALALLVMMLAAWFVIVRVRRTDGASH